MKDEFFELIKIFDLKDIQFIDSHESVLSSIKTKGDVKVSVKTDQMIPVEDPKFENDNMICHPKYVLSFEMDNKVFFKCEYILIVVFKCKDLKRAQELLGEEENKNFFFGQQMNRTVWTILRSVVMDAFNRHSLKPVILPWIK